MAATVAREKRVYLGIMHVKVQGKGSDRMVERYFLLDIGLEVTLCHERLAKELEINGDRLSFTLTGMTYLPNNKPMAEQRSQLLKKRSLKDEELLNKAL